MRHDLSIQGNAYRLRPVTLDDATFIVALRTDPACNRFINYTTPDVDAQIAWLERYFERPNDYYFIVENLATGEREGTVGIYDIDPVVKLGEWGRWVVRPGSKAGIESLVLILDVAFNVLKLHALKTHTAVQNLRVIAILERYGMTRVQTLPGYININGVAYDALEHWISNNQWRSQEQI